MVEHIADRATTFDKVEILEEHAHKAAKVYPTLAAGVSVVSGGTAWTLGSFTEVIPASTVGTDFDLHWIVLEDVTDDETYELAFYAVETEIARIRFSADNPSGNRVTVSPIPIQMEIQPKDVQIQVKLASSGITETIIMSVIYHVY